MALSALPAITRLTLARVTAVPAWHPEHATFQPFPVHAWVVRHPDGIVLVDTGVGIGNNTVDEWYRPEVVPLRVALGGVGLVAEDISAVVLTHLHFDHCGQQDAVAAPVHVQEVEHDVAAEPGYTVAEWAAIPATRLRLVRGEDEVLEGIRLLPTPGHTPGHQSVVIEAGGDRVVLAGQCAFGSEELRSGNPSPTNLHDATWSAAARASLERIAGLAPVEAHLSHDPEVVRLL